MSAALDEHLHRAHGWGGRAEVGDRDAVYQLEKQVERRLVLERADGVAPRDVRMVDLLEDDCFIDETLPDVDETLPDVAVGRPFRVEHLQGPAQAADHRLHQVDDTEASGPETGEHPILAADDGLSQTRVGRPRGGGAFRSAVRAPGSAGVVQ